MIVENESLVLANFKKKILTPTHRADDSLFIKVGSKRTRLDQGDIDEYDHSL
jgi:hypothetical protein